MPPKAAIARPLSPTPPPPPAPVSAAASAHTEQNDILVIQDFMDTIDQIPTELTRVHSDLNELGAVLYSTLCNLERKLHQLIDWVQSPRVGPEQRFQLLQEIAEEAARYKLGGDDKIRVAGGACDGIMAHQRHISNLLKHSTLLEKDPPSPYTAALTLPQLPVAAATRRGQTRATGSPFPGRHDDRATPTKKRKNRKEVAGRVDDDDASSVNGRDEKKKAPTRKKKTNRAVSPSESVASTAIYGKPSEPVARTARQIAAAAAKARAAQKKDEDSDESGDDEPRRGGKAMQVSASNDSTVPGGALGIDLGSREGSAGKSGGTTPAQQSGGDKARARAGGRGTKRARGDEEDEDDDEEQDDEPPAKRPGATASAGKKTAATYAESAVADTDNGAGDAEVDSKVYCTCRQFSYGEMIGCDDDECEIEWYHVACLNLDKAPEGNWICPQCLERRKRNPKAKKPAKPKRK